MTPATVQRHVKCPTCGRTWQVESGTEGCPNCGVLATPICACSCGDSLAGMRSDAVFRSEACEKRRKRAPSADIAPTHHPLEAARTEQEASKLNRDLGALIRAAIVRRLSGPPYRVHADDLEGDFPAEHVERCRKLAPAQFGGLAGAGDIREVERRKSAVPSRKGAKSSVYEFTISGRRKLAAGVSAGVPTPQGPEGDLSHLTGASADPGGADTARLFEPAPERPLNPLADAEAA